jgi:glycine/D-amino acid oxidase-like deaminating enzyme
MVAPAGADYEEKSFWLATAGPYSEEPPLDAEIEADVAVVGGGFCGLSSAYYLKRANPSLDVVLLEDKVIGYGASGRNAGFAMTLMGLTMEMTALRFGKERAREAYEFGHRAVDHVGQMVDAHGIDCDYEKPGLLTVATNEAQAKRLQHEIRLAEEIGVDSFSWIDGAEMRAKVDSPTYMGARWEAQCALINPAKLARGMKRVAMDAGVSIFERTPVAGIRPGKERVTLMTDRADVRASKVVLATNAFSAAMPQLRSKQLPVYTYIVLTEPLHDARLGAIGWAGRQGIEDARNLIHYYRLTADNRLLFGGSDAMYYYGNKLNRDSNAKVFRQLKNDIGRTFPGLKGTRIEYKWGGPVSVPLDFFPSIGYLGDDRRIVFSLGCVGHGVALMNFAGQIVRDLVLEDQTELTDLFFVNRRMIPLPPEPLRFAVGEAMRGAFKGLDAWEGRGAA